MRDDVLKRVTSIEGSVEEELKDLYREREDLVKQLNALMVSSRLKDFKNSIVKAAQNGEDINEQVYDGYVAALNQMIDLMNAIKIYDKSIILFETGYDPEDNEVMDTDMDFPEHPADVEELG